MEAQRQDQHPHVGTPLISTEEGALESARRALTRLDFAGTLTVDAALTLETGGETIVISGENSELTIRIDRPLRFIRRRKWNFGDLSMLRKLTELCDELGIRANISHGEKIVAVAGHGVSSDRVARVIGFKHLRLQR